MEQHVKIISILDIVFGGLAIFGGILMMVLMSLGAAGISGSGEQNAAGAAAILASVGLIGGVFIIILGAFEIYVGMSLKAYKSWARIAQIVFGALALPSIPIGTALGVYYIWAMTNKETAALFEKGAPTA